MPPSIRSAAKTCSVVRFIVGPASRKEHVGADHIDREARADRVANPLSLAGFAYSCVIGQQFLGAASGKLIKLRLKSDQHIEAVGDFIFLLPLVHVADWFGRHQLERIGLGKDFRRPAAPDGDAEAFLGKQYRFRYKPCAFSNLHPQLVS